MCIPAKMGRRSGLKVGNFSGSFMGELEQFDAGIFVFTLQILFSALALTYQPILFCERCEPDDQE